MKDARARRQLRSFPSFVPLEPGDCNQAIHRRFEGQVTRRPDAIAIRQPGRDVSYAQLNVAANRRARRLIASWQSEATGRPVALLLRQGYDSIVSTLAILKAGCCYAPLDQRLPPEILRGMIDDLQPAAVLVDDERHELGRSIAAGAFPVIDVTGTGDERCAAENLDRPIAADAIACIFCTSGSTGRPKSIADSHRNVLHNVCRYTNTLRFAPDDRLSLVQNPSFSGTVSTLFGALVNGAAVVPFDLQGDGLSTLSDGVRRAGVTIVHAVPSIFRELSDASTRFGEIRLIRLEGDRATERDLRHFRSNFQAHCTLVNGLGATECGIVRQFFVDHETAAGDGEAIPVGYPVPDVKVNVVDDEGRERPAGTPGEIVIESRFLATGYWRNPSLTAQRFETVGDGQRRYRTGDLGRMDDDGCLTHLGRIDHRVRIAGEFIDTADIERVLHTVPGVAHAVVHEYVDRTSEQRLCAAIVRDAGSHVTSEQLRAALSERVAQSAMPAAFMFLDALPLTRDLKVDRGNLPVPRGERPEMSNDYVAPETRLEEQLAQVWSEVLDIDAVGVTDSLFLLGGDSLRAAKIVNRLQATWGDRVRVTTLFEFPTVRSLARALDQE